MVRRQVSPRCGSKAEMLTVPPKPKVGREPRFVVDKWFRLALRNLIKSFTAYQPVRFEGRLLQPGKRDFEHRWTLIRREVVACGARTLLDLGCAEGFFIHRAAHELGCFSLGIDADVRRLTVAQNINTLERNELTGFMYGHIDLASLSCLPKFDIVLFLSVLHHFMRPHGIDYCREVLRIIRTKTNKALIFDMGVESERSDSAKDLTSVNEEPSAWVGEFLRSAGFSQVDVIGHSTARMGRVSRPMFRALP